MLLDPMGLQTWTDLPRGFEDRDNGRCLGLSDFGLATCNQESSEFSLQTSSGASQSSYDASSASSSSNFDADVSLSSYLMDGNVRAMLKKVTVNEGALNQTIESLGGGEKGLKELMGYIMSWVREHQGSENLSLSPKLENMHKPPLTFGYGATPLEPLHRLDESTNDLHQFYQPCTKSRRLDEGVVDRCDVYRSSFVNVSGGVPEEFQFAKPEMITGGYSSIGPVMLQQGMYHQQQAVNLSSPGLFSFASGRNNDLSRTLAATTTRAARRNRIARQRQQSLPRNGTTPAVSWSVSPPTTLDLRNAGMFLPGAPPAVVVPGRKANYADTLTFLFQKELRPSDVGNLGRIILPKKEAEMHLPILELREGVVLQMEDFDSGVCWNIRYRFWPNNKSRMYLLESTGELVKRHHLQEGDLLILYRNQQGNYVLRGKKNVLSDSRGGPQGIQQKNAHSLARGFLEASKTEEVPKERDFGLEDRSCQKVVKERGFGLDFEDRKAMKAEPKVLVGDDDPFFKEDVMHNIGSTFGPGLLQPLERFPSWNLDFPLDEIMAAISKDDTENEPYLGLTKVVPKTEPAG